MRISKKLKELNAALDIMASEPLTIPSQKALQGAEEIFAWLTVSTRKRVEEIAPGTAGKLNKADCRRWVAHFMGYVAITQEIILKVISDKETYAMLSLPCPKCEAEGTETHDHSMVIETQKIIH